MVKDGKPSDRELEELSLKLGKKWKELGSCLEFDDAAITNLDEDNKELAYYVIVCYWPGNKEKASKPLTQFCTMPCVTNWWNVNF